MSRGQTVLVSCEIGPGPFSGERLFRLELKNGQTYSGLAPIHYCFNTSKRPIDPREFTNRPMIDGLIEAVLVANGGEDATVELPDGQAVTIKMSQVPYRQTSRETEYVSL